MGVDEPYGNLLPAGDIIDVGTEQGVVHQPNGLPAEDFTSFGDPQDPAIRHLAGYGRDIVVIECGGPDFVLVHVGAPECSKSLRLVECVVGLSGGGGIGDTLPFVPEVPEAWLDGTRVGVETWIVLP